jgi:hypothetical protein
MEIFLSKNSPAVQILVLACIEISLTVYIPPARAR